MSKYKLASSFNYIVERNYLLRSLFICLFLYIFIISYRKSYIIFLIEINNHSMYLRETRARTLSRTLTRLVGDGGKCAAVARSEYFTSAPFLGISWNVLTNKSCIGKQWRFSLLLLFPSPARSRALIKLFDAVALNYFRVSRIDEKCRRASDRLENS